jgi:hypothetical protein
VLLTFIQWYPAIKPLQLWENYTELVFIIVPDRMLDFDVLIGCNLFHDSELFTVTDHSGTHVLRKQVPAVRRAFEGRTSQIQVYDVPSVVANVK